MSRVMVSAGLETGVSKCSALPRTCREMAPRKVARTSTLPRRSLVVMGSKNGSNGANNTDKSILPEGVRQVAQSAKDAVMGAGKTVKEAVTERPMFAPSEDFNTSYLTTNSGNPIVNNEFSLTVGNRGPVLLEDFHFMEKMGQFNREKVPERVVHARGMVAKGYFEVTHDVTDITCAKVFGSVGKKTNLAARFSTVTHEKGSPESLRDVRGFSVKMYTEDGNWDFVGNNIPVFFIRDGMQFPDLVHALRPNPKNHIQEGWRILDFLAAHPESTNILTWLLDEPGIPANWRQLEGYSVNTFTFVNADGKETLIKLHWKPKDGVAFLTDDEAAAIGEKNARHSHATQDLYNAIENGHYPEWELCVQTMDPADQEKFYFDPLDCTKEWPTEDFPERPIGRMVLNKNIDNFHAESEQIAFSPGIAVPGITYSNDKVLQTRVHAYADTQRYRIGVNYQMLPINQPQCPFHNNHHDGAMNFMHRSEEVNYYPSLISKKDKPTSETAPKGVWQSEVLNGVRTKADLDKTGDADFVQAGVRYRSMDARRKELFENNFVGWMADPKCTDEVRDVWYSHWAKVDPELEQNLRRKVPEKMQMEKEKGAPMTATKA